MVVVHFERALSGYWGIIDKLQDLVKVLHVPFPQLHEDIEELVEHVVPWQVRDDNVGCLGVRFMVAESETEFGVRARQDERVRVHCFTARRGGSVKGDSMNLMRIRGVMSSVNSFRG